MCINKLCKASITTQESSIDKTTGIKADGSHDYEHQPKMSFNVYACGQSIKQKIDQQPTAPVSMLYDATTVPYSLSRTLTNESFLFCSNVLSIFGFFSLTSRQLLASNQH